METLQDKTAIVLGASSAYGAATARMLGREGAAVVLGGRSRDKLEALEEEIVSSGGRAVSLGVHLAKRHHLEHLVEAAVETFGGPDILVFAARAFSPPLKSLDVEAFERSVDVNVKGLLYTLTAVLPAMQETGGGHVVYLGPEQPEDEDPLYEAGLAAADVLLRESCRAFGSGGGVRASELFIPADMEAEQCAETVRGALLTPDEKTPRFSTYGI